MRDCRDARTSGPSLEPNQAHGDGAEKNDDEAGQRPRSKHAKIRNDALSLITDGFPNKARGAAMCTGCKTSKLFVAATWRPITSFVPCCKPLATEFRGVPRLLPAQITLQMCDVCCLF